MADQDQQSSYIYDAFISFSSTDTRRGFIDLLLKTLRDGGIYTFSDDEGELQKGDKISSLLINPIQDSKTAIIVLSKNYASSQFCLEELSYILDNFQGNRHRPIIPIFYDVEPSDVRKLQGTYGEAFTRHGKTYFSHNNQKWMNALNQVANISGFILHPGVGSESKLIERIVETVSTGMFDHAPLHNPYTVGLEYPFKEVCFHLELNSVADVQMLGIYGYAGIGKTTLAREVYNRISHQFDASCFLSDVRENSNKYGLPHLQNMLVSEMIGWKDIKLQNANKGSTLIQQRLRRMKVLLILDDVDKLEQLEALVGGTDWFASGSRVIITTRDRSLLTFHRIVRTYEVQPLNRQDALELLLSQQIFKEGNADPSNTGTLNELVTYAAGLPLALKVMGSYLFGKPVDEWTTTLRQFKRVRPEGIQTLLKSTFDALREDEKRVFLDIACCFNGYELAKLVDILSAHHGNNAKLHIDVLIDKSLVSIGSDDKVRLHPLVEDMGKHIVHQESPDEPGRRSRLWLLEDIVEVLKNNKGTRYTEIIHLDSPSIEDEEAIEWDGEAFKNMINLRTLIIRKCNFSKAPKYLPNSLRVLEWWRYPAHELPSDFKPTHLNICDLPRLPDLSEAEKEKVDRDIRLWSSGKENDIILLLSTLHQIMWPESGWEEVSYMSLKENLQQVKKAYRKAILCLHPDKLQQRRATLIQKYIGEKVFIILQTSQNVPQVSETSSTVDEVLSQSSQEGSSTSIGVLVPQTSQSDPGVLSQSSQEVSPTSRSYFVVSQIFQSVLGVLSQRSQQVFPTSEGVLVSQTSQSDPGVLSRSSQEVSPTSWSDFVVSQSVLGVLSQVSQQVSPTSEGVLVSRTSQRVPRVLSQSSQEVSPTSGSTSVSSQTSGSVPEVSRSSQEVSQATSLADDTVRSQRSPHVSIRLGFETSRSVPKVFDWETWIWRVVGTLSGVVGPLFFALSPPSKCVMKEQKLLIILCSTWTLVIWVFLHCVKPTEFSKKHRRYTGYVVFLILSIYSFFYDKAVDDKPSIYSVVSNAAFALVSFSKSKLNDLELNDLGLNDLGFETGTFCYFLTCLTIQLMGLKSKFYLFGILLTCPLFLWYFPSKQKDETLPVSIPKNITRPKSEIELQNSGKKAE